MKRPLIIIWGSFLVIVLLMLLSHLRAEENSKALYEALREEYSLQAMQEEVAPIVVKEAEPSIIAEGFKPLLEKNKDIVGWITIPDTAIDYPVVRTNDNEFYLKHDFNRNPSKAGAIFMDFRNISPSTSKNTILYGHYMKNGTMFGQLERFKEEAFLKANRIIEFNSLYEEIKWEIFSVYVTDVGFDYIRTSFDSEEAYGDFLASIVERTMYQLDTRVSVADEILTLSTCSYEFDNARFVVHAKRLNN